MSEHENTIREALGWAQDYAPDRIVHRLLDALDALGAWKAEHAAETERLRSRLNRQEADLNRSALSLALSRDVEHLEKIEREFAEARAENERLRDALADACDVAVWMSGSYDFGPGGGAFGGWTAGGQRDKLHRAMAALAAQEPPADGGDR